MCLLLFCIYKLVDFFRFSHFFMLLMTFVYFCGIFSCWLCDFAVLCTCSCRPLDCMYCMRILVYFSVFLCWFACISVWVLVDFSAVCIFLLTCVLSCTYSISCWHLWFCYFIAHLCIVDIWICLLVDLCIVLNILSCWLACSLVCIFSDPFVLFCLHSISCWLWGCMYVYSCVILCVFSCWLVYYSVCIVLLISVLFKCIFLLTCVILLFCSPSMYCWLLCCLNVSSCWLLYSFECVFLSTCVFFCMYFLRSFCAVSYVQYLLLTLILLICIVDFCVFLDDFYVVTDLFFWCKMSALQRITYPGIDPCSLDVFPIKNKIHNKLWDMQMTSDLANWNMPVCKV